MDTSTRLKLGFAALMILSGIGVASYPVISNMVAQRRQYGYPKLRRDRA